MSVRSALRTATAEDHRNVDTIFGGFRLHEASGYRDFLKATAAAHLPAEAAVEASGAADLLADWPVRRRAKLLRDDLNELELAGPKALPAPDLTSAAATLGGIYVLEGSRLGGALLKRNLPPGMPRRFLDAPSQPGAWRHLGELLDDRLRSSHELAEAITAAKQVFGLFAQAGLAVLEPAK